MAININTYKLLVLIISILFYFNNCFISGKHIDDEKVKLINWNTNYFCPLNTTLEITKNGPFQNICHMQFGKTWKWFALKQNEETMTERLNGNISERDEYMRNISSISSKHSPQESKTKGNNSKDQTENQNITNTPSFTFVSALFDLHREDWPKFKRKYNQYLNYSIQLLMMNVPLVAFIDSAAEPFVRQYRQGKENMTKIIVTSLDQLEYYEDYQTIKNIMDSDNFQANHTFLNHPEGFSPEYNILMNSKCSMMHHAATKNYFNTSHLYWIDMGYGHGSDVFPKTQEWAPANLMNNQSISDKITYIQINNVKLLRNIYQIYKRNVPPFLSGGFFGGSKAAVVHYYFVHREMFKLFLRHKMVDDDQTLAILCYFKEQTLFNFVDGWWYDAFKLFN